MPGSRRSLYPRLAVYYFFHFGALGALLPFLGPYLEARGLDAGQVGLVFGLMMGARIIVPTLWGLLADRLGRPVLVVRVGTFSAFACFALFARAAAPAATIAAMALFAVFWAAALPQFEATTLEHLGVDARRYGSIRLWGSVGFILAVLSAGVVVQHVGVAALVYLVLAMLAAIWLSSLAVPESRRAHMQEETGPPLGPVLRRREVVVLFLVCFLMQASHGPYYAFFSLFLHRTGYSDTVISQLWALGVVAEILVFMGMGRLLTRFTPRTLLLASLGLASLRWLMIASEAGNIYVLSVAQTLHLASFGVFHAVAIHLIHRHFGGRLHGRGQALYSSIGFGAGGAVGSLVAGYLWTAAGPASVFYGAAIAAAAGFLIALTGLPKRGSRDAQL